MQMLDLMVNYFKKKSAKTEVKDCFENLNRATFAFNQALDGILFKPVASAYKVLPSPVQRLV